jgi:hypothetical protein
MANGPYTFYFPPVRIQNLSKLAKNHGLYPTTYNVDKFLKGLWLPGPSGVTTSSCPAQFTIRSWDVEAQSLFGEEWTSQVDVNPPHALIVPGGDDPISIPLLDDTLSPAEALFAELQMISVRYVWLLSWYKCAKQLNDAFGAGPSKGGNVAT